MGWFRERWTATNAEPAADAALVRSYVQNADAAAMAMLVDRHLPMVYRVCRSVLHRDQDAEDATQTAFLVLTRRAESIRNPNALASWLHGVALQSAKAVRRRQQREQVRVEKVAKPESGGTLLDDLTVREARELLHAAIDALPERDKLPILLIHFEDHSIEEAAKTLGLSLPAFRGRLERARQRLAESLKRRGLTLGAALGVGMLTVPVPSAMAATVTTALATNTHSAGVTAAAALVPVPAGTSPAGVAAMLLGAAALLVGVPLLWPSPPMPATVHTYARGHVLVARGDHVAILNPDDGRAVPVTPALTAGQFKSLRVPADGALAYEKDDGTLHAWRFDEPFPGVQVARNAECFAWLNDGRLAVVTNKLELLRLTTGEREAVPLPAGLRVIDIHPDGDSVLAFDSATQRLGIRNITNGTVQVLDAGESIQGFADWRFAPQGRAVGGVVHADGVTQLIVAEPGSTTKRVVPCDDAGRLVAWSPDGQAVLVSRRSQPTTLLLVPLDRAPRLLHAVPPTGPATLVLQSGGADWCR